MTNINKIIDQLLHLEDPWFVSNVKYDLELKKVDIYLDFKKGSKFPCPVCGKLCSVYDTKERDWRHLDMFEYKVYLHAREPRVECGNDGIKVAKVNWAEIGSNFTLHFETLVLSFAREMSVAAVAELVDIHPDSVWRILGRYVQKEVDKMDLKDVRLVGMDEIGIGKGYEFLTLFANLEGETAKVIFMVEGKDAETVKAFRNRLGEAFSSEIIKQMIFTMDMSNAFISGVTTHFKGAKIVFDRYHVMVKVNEAVDKTRKEESWDEDILLGTRYLWLKNPENLTREQMKELKSVKKLDLKTARAYQIKLALQRFWKFENIYRAEEYLKKWYFWASHSKLRFIVDVGRTIKAHWYGIMNSLIYRLSNGPMEGLNNKIKTAFKRAYGFKSIDYMTTIIYLIAGDIKLPTRC